MCSKGLGVRGVLLPTGRMDVYADRLELLGIDAMMSLKLSLSQQQARSAVLSTA